MTGGVAFRCNTSYNTLRKLTSVNEEVTLYTYLSVREDALDLFGFYDTAELDCFKLLISVSGVGPKAALAILSKLSPDALSQSVATGNVKAITAAQGVGPKIAQRIIAELKDKLAPFAGQGQGISIDIPASPQGAAAEAADALVSLGFSRSEASIAVGRLDPSLPVDELIKKALSGLSGGF